MSTSKLLSRFVVIAAVGLMVAACTSAPASEPSSEAVIPDDELVEPGKLTIATTGSADPFTIINEDGDLV